MISFSIPLVGERACTFLGGVLSAPYLSTVIIREKGKPPTPPNPASSVSKYDLVSFLFLSYSTCVDSSSSAGWSVSLSLN
jgi:hypothetical protein